MNSVSFRSVEADDFINIYVEILCDEWHIRIDHEDGSTAPFTTLVAEMADE